MQNRRNFIQTAAVAGIAGIVAAQTAPAFAQDTKIKKIGVLGLGSHSFAARFKTRPEGYTKEILAKPYGVWDDYPGVAEVMKADVYEKVYTDPVQLAKECDCIHIEHGGLSQNTGTGSTRTRNGETHFHQSPVRGLGRRRRGNRPSGPSV